MTKQERARLTRECPALGAQIDQVYAEIRGIRKEGRVAEAAANARLEAALPAVREALTAILPEANFLSIYVGIGVGIGSGIGSAFVNGIVLDNIPEPAEFE